jgi:hypothetical protein
MQKGASEMKIGPYLDKHIHKWAWGSVVVKALRY